MVEEGKPAPDFELTSDAGETVKLSDLRGKPSVAAARRGQTERAVQFALAR